MAFSDFYLELSTALAGLTDDLGASMTFTPVSGTPIVANFVPTSTHPELEDVMGNAKLISGRIEDAGKEPSPGDSFTHDGVVYKVTSSRVNTVGWFIATCTR